MKPDYLSSANDEATYARCSKRQLWDVAVVLAARLRGVTKPAKLLDGLGRGPVDGVESRLSAHVKYVANTIETLERDRRNRAGRR